MQYEDCSFDTRQAPWDENMGVLRSPYDSRKYEDLFITALKHEARDSDTEDRLMCVLVHAHCWQLLSRHRAWSLSWGNMKTLLQALICKKARHYNKPVKSFGEIFYGQRLYYPRSYNGNGNPPPASKRCSPLSWEHTSSRLNFSL